LGLANKTLDLRGITCHNHPREFNPVHIQAVGDGFVVHGLRVEGDQPLTTPWRVMKNEGGATTSPDPNWNDASIFIERDAIADLHKGTVRIESCAFYDSFDTIRSQGDHLGRRITTSGCYIRSPRDDAFENDGLNGHDIIDCLVDNANNFMSQKPGGESDPPASTNITNVNNCLIHIGQNWHDVEGSGDIPNSGSKWTQKYPNGTNMGSTSAAGYVGGRMFKFVSDSGKMVFRRCIIRIDRLARAGRGEMPLQGGSDNIESTFEDCVLVWLGDGSCPDLPADGGYPWRGGASGGSPPTGLTVMTGTDGYNFWLSERAKWLTAHGARDANGDDFDFLHV
jgi:hypothetical protein